MDRGERVVTHLSFRFYSRSNRPVAMVRRLDIFRSYGRVRISGYRTQIRTKQSFRGRVNTLDLSRPSRRPRRRKRHRAGTQGRLLLNVGSTRFRPTKTLRHSADIEPRLTCARGLHDTTCSSVPLELSPAANFSCPQHYRVIKERCLGPNCPQLHIKTPRHSVGLS